jgi:hypothetical protein
VIVPSVAQLMQSRDCVVMGAELVCGKPYQRVQIKFFIPKLCKTPRARFGLPTARARLAN